MMRLEDVKVGMTVELEATPGRWQSAVIEKICKPHPDPRALRLVKLRRTDRTYVDRVPVLGLRIPEPEA